MPTPALKLFYSYAHKDEALREDLETHLKILKRQGLLESWNDRCLSAGTEWAGVIDENLEKADIIVLLVSANFLASDYSIDTELKRAMERHEAREARVIPIFIKPCDWSDAPFGKLQGLPRDARPVVTWPIQDEAWTDVARGIRRVIEEIRAQRGASPVAPAARRATAAVAPAVAAASPAPAGGRPTGPSLRRLLGEVLRGADFDAFCLDYFPATYGRFGGGMESVQKTTLLLLHEEPRAILDALRHRAPAAVAKHEGLLEFV
jgi:hypothetical protein